MAIFYEWLNTASTTRRPRPTLPLVIYKDVIVPGDYDGDGKTDVGLASVIGTVQWRMRITPERYAAGTVQLGRPE